MTTIAGFVSTLAGLSVTGVSRSFTYAPRSIQTADIPASFVDLPSADASTALASCTTAATLDAEIIKTADLVVLVEPIGQEQESQNFSDALTMADNVKDALVTARGAGTFGTVFPPTWTLDVTIRPHGEVQYWAVVATVTAQG